MSQQPWEYALLWWGAPEGSAVLLRKDDAEEEDTDRWVSFTHHDTWELPKEAVLWDVLRYLGESGWEMVATDYPFGYTSRYMFKRRLQPAAAVPEAKEQLGFRTTPRKREGSQVSRPRDTQTP